VLLYNKEARKGGDAMVKPARGSVLVKTHDKKLKRNLVSIKREDIRFYALLWR